jgi:hypothetical protein
MKNSHSEIKRQFLDYKSPYTITTRHGQFTIYIASRFDLPPKLFCPFSGKELNIAPLIEIVENNKNYPDDEKINQKKIEKKSKKKRGRPPKPILIKYSEMAETKKPKGQNDA